ncbi:hypothetical protein BT93_L0374 [Corymbia citriodora subsp. variegata]|uniref:Uncharacterized protein n=1 Tax=Corymbia citriodora subsp. variegata TaxID=360336 RepID=A0A8T0CPV5_CORYI|nr:hypothetical protein BT93_L0374 [Corymbia citriodora subsp. variegata]
MEGQRCCLILAMLCFLHLASSIETSGAPEENAAKEMIRVGLVFSMSTSMGKAVESCISMAHSDFYGAHPDYHTRLSLLVRDPKDDIVDAASAGKYMLLCCLCWTYWTRLHELDHSQFQTFIINEF